MIQSLPPLCVALPYHENTADYFAVIRNMNWSVFLDSANTNGNNGRYDILAADPFIRISSSADDTQVRYRDDQHISSEADPFQLLQEVLSQYPTTSGSLPFSGGAIGYFAYDLGRRIETIPNTAQNAEQTPDMAVGIYDWALVVDHELKQCWLCSHGFDPYTHQIWPELTAKLQSTIHAEQKSTFHVHGPLNTNLDYTEYQTAFDKIQHYITEGDCYQVNLAKRFEIEASGDPWSAYQILRKQNAAPFSAFLDFGEVSVLSSSPERLLQVHQGQVETKPIKGTRPRDLNDPVNDQKLADELQNSVKDRAENLMIVDLLRNDLGKVCEPGSIRVPHAFTLESFATVHHLVSTVTGELAEGETAVSLLKACFPGGSITGAPKLRAMEIIEELEPHRRGIYCGSIGYIGFDGEMDTNITIRTMVFSDNRLRFWAGGGIVTDSNVDAEYQEVDDKAAAMFKLIETLRQP